MVLIFIVVSMYFYKINNRNFSVNQMTLNERIENHDDVEDNASNYQYEIMNENNFVINNRDANVSNHQYLQILNPQE